jgi:hypothetical protein
MPDRREPIPPVNRACLKALSIDLGAGLSGLVYAE